MKTQLRSIRSGLVLTSLLFPGLAAASGPIPSPVVDQPLTFELNDGQADRSVDFVAHGDGYQLLLSEGTATLVTSGAARVVELVPIGASVTTVEGELSLTSKSHYIRGSDRRDWIVDVPHARRVTYPDVYPGIDLVYYGSGRQVELDFVVAPGSDPDVIALEVVGADALKPTADGALALELGGRSLTLRAPVAYQRSAAGDAPVDVAYDVSDDHTIRFLLGDYDRSRPLIIDPVIGYATMLGGTGLDEAHGVAVDAAGAIYVAGQTGSTDFPYTAGAYQDGTLLDPRRLSSFVSKFASDGTLVYSTYLHGNTGVRVSGVAVDASGRASISAVSGPNSDLPTTPNAPVSVVGIGNHGYVATLNAAGSGIDFATFLTAAGLNGIAVDDGGHIYVTGGAATFFPTTASAYSQAHSGGGDAIIARLDPSAATDALVYSTYLGGAGGDSGDAIAVDDRGHAYVVGHTGSTNPLNIVFPTVSAAQTDPANGTSHAFVAKIDTAATGEASLSYSTFLGGSGSEMGTVKNGGIAVLPGGEAIVTGATQSSDFPVTAGAFQTTWGGGTSAFVTKLSADGTSFLYSTYIGSGIDHQGLDLAAADNGVAFVVGRTGANLPVEDAFQSTLASVPDAFVLALSADGGSLLYSSYLGGNGTDIAYGVAADASGRAYVTGYSTAGSNPFPTSGNAHQGANAGGADAFLVVVGPPAGCEFAADGTSCDDGDACTQTDTCQAGVCTGADPVVCGGGGVCMDGGVCDPTTGTCSEATPSAAGTACDDDDLCTQSSTCDGAGSCVGSDPVVCTAKDQCHGVGVCEPTTGVCSDPPLSGNDCDDGDACTLSDSCVAGSCLGSTPVICTASDQCHDVGICNPATGICSEPEKADDTACDDGDACTQSDTCQAGLCTGANPVVCSASDQCHDAGVCDSNTGLCTDPAKPDGTLCTDNDLCTQADSCQGGVCIGADPVICFAASSCQDPGTCDPNTGFCSVTNLPDGTSCDDNNLCTQADSCAGGFCIGGAPVVCPGAGQCLDGGTCEPSSGTCSYAPLPDGAFCDDLDPCTTSDACQSGICLSATNTCGCPAPTLADCLDPVYPQTACGETAAQGGICDLICPPPTSADCNDPQYAPSLCGETASAQGLCDPICASQTPTSADCENDDEWYQSICGGAEYDAYNQALAAQDPSLSECASLCTTFNEGALIWTCDPGGDEEDVLVPQELSNDGVDHPAGSDEVTTTSVIDESDKAETEGSLESYEGFWKRYHSAKGLQKAFLDIAIAGWDTNGNDVTSCTEYVYEKYYDWSLYQDQVHHKGADFRAYVDKAYKRTNAFVLSGNNQLTVVKVPADGAIGAMGIDGEPLRSRDNTILPRQPVIGPVQRSKNIFFTLAPEQAPDPNNPPAPQPASYWPPHLDPYLPPEAYTGCGGGVLGFQPCDATLAVELWAGKDIEYTEDWAWHEQMSDDLEAAGWLDEHLYRADQLKQRLRVALLERRRRVEEFLELLSHDDNLPQEFGMSPGFVIEQFLVDHGPAVEVLARSSALQRPHALASALIPPVGSDGLGLLYLQTSNLTDTTGIGTNAYDDLMANAALIGNQVTETGFYAPAAFDLNLSQNWIINPDPNNTSALTPLDPATQHWQSFLAATTRFNLLNFSPIDRAKLLQARIIEIDVQIEDLLLEARELHCLDSTGVSPCDWSPKDFALRVRDLYLTEQEADYSRCRKNTTVDPLNTLSGKQFVFREQNNPKVPYVKGGLGETGVTDYTCFLDPNGQPYINNDSNYGIPVSCSGTWPECMQTACPTCNQWAQSTTHVDFYFRCVDAYKTLVLETVQEAGVLAKENGEVHLGQSMGDTNKDQAGDFAAFYGYGFGWELAGFQDYADPNVLFNVCDMTPQAWGYFETGAILFGYELDLIQASAHAQVGQEASEDLPQFFKDDTDLQNYVLLEIMEQDIFEIDLDFNVGFNVTGGEKVDTTLFEAEIPFMAGPIPMSVGFGVAGFLGLDFKAEGKLGTTNPCPKIVATAEPYAAVLAFATLAVDLVVAEVGVKIDITVAELRLPLKASAELELPNGIPRLLLKTQLDIIVKALGGSMAIYLEILTESWEFTLFKWDGLVYGPKNLFQASIELPLLPLVEAINALITSQTLSP